MIQSAWQEIIQYGASIDPFEFAGLIFGLLAVLFLIKEHILTWPAGIIYCLLSFVVFWKFQLYGDFLLHIIFLILNIYGWYTWTRPDSNKNVTLKITAMGQSQALKLLGLTVIGIILFAQVLIYIPTWIDNMQPAAVPYADSTTSILSVTGMWLTTRKYINNWYYWLVVDILATGIYIYKGIHFYAFLYFIYIGLAVAGYLAWKKTMALQEQAI